MTARRMFTRRSSGLLYSPRKNEKAFYGSGSGIFRQRIGKCGGTCYTIMMKGEKARYQTIKRNDMKKRILALILTAAALLSLAGCGNQNAAPTDPGEASAAAREAAMAAYEQRIREFSDAKVKFK